jgi:hypothetical protein
MITIYLEEQALEEEEEEEDHIFLMELAHLLTRSGLTCLEPIQRSAMILFPSRGVVLHYPG